ncbi:hypothetical protein K7X08_034184 [Anisodus acutangulus]|uniref:E2 ubiquitin-conjugating enzyme n=1 Tax=Anisodus acutangulus TaxID=402998 RepID=A0A9Q1LF12_9SOLA|nr:hypothetical protein K7X08_034184 [Anisodus acutangulus]
MVSVGRRALILRKHKGCDLTEQPTARENQTNNQGESKRTMGRKSSKKMRELMLTILLKLESVSRGNADDNSRPRMDKNATRVPQTSFLRQQVDPETAKYFAEIANAIEGTEIDPEERSVICGNALEETRGKEAELATDYIISHTLQTLLEGCSLDHLCSFLQSCASKFSHIAADRSGSHVVETALKSLSFHLQDNENHSLIEKALTKVCKAIVVNPVDVMCNCHGSHVLRSLLCLFKGVPLEEFHSSKSSVGLAERLNVKARHAKDNGPLQSQQIFPNLLKHFVSEMLNAASEDISTLQVNQFSSLVLQTALKSLAGNEQELLHLIRVLLGSSTESANAENLLEGKTIRNILRLVEETAYSHLMEAILEFAPETLYNELLTKVFRKSLFRMSTHHCANFVVQALASHAKSPDHMDLIWEEIGTKFHDLFEMGKAGVVASVLAAIQRLHSHEHECCQAIAAAVCTGDEFPKCIVPRILFLENFFCSRDKSNWSWPHGTKIHVVGSLILQSIIKLPSELIQVYVTSITSLEEHQVLEASKDPSGSRVIESFLNSNISAKQKRKLVVKLRGHFGELSVHPFGSFTGPYLLRKLDIDGFARQPDQWKSRQASQQSALKEFYATFGPTETKSNESVRKPFEKESFLADTVSKSKPGKLKDIRKEIETTLASAKTSNTPFLAHQTELRNVNDVFSAAGSSSNISIRQINFQFHLDLRLYYFFGEKACVKRLQKEYRALCKEPVSHVVARPSPNDILEWHYVLDGSEGTPFAGGYYYGKIKFPPEYPFKPPGISMTTPNGRFMTQKKICLSMSDFHPESWNPMWSVSSILTGLLSFMMDNSPTTGSVTTTVAEKEKLAKASLAFNCKNPTFRKLFPEYVEKYEQQQLPEQVSSMPAQAEQSRPLLEEDGNSTNDEMNRVKPLKDVKNQQRKSFPTWLLLLLVSIFGVVMALPLLQL